MAYAKANQQAQTYSESDARVKRAWGPEPLPDATHLLPRLTLPAPTPPLSPGPNPATEFTVRVIGGFPVEAEAFYEALRGSRTDMGFYRLWVCTPRFPGVWWAGDDLPTSGQLGAVAFSWELTGVLSEGVEAIGELARYALQAGERLKPLGLQVTVPVAPIEAVARAAQLNALKVRFARAIELRLVPVGRVFPARAVWRYAYALGLVWGPMDLFHWYDASGQTRLFTVSRMGQPGTFLPERAEEGEGVPGLVFSLELPACPLPVPTFERMAIALAHLREPLHARPVTRDGTELDSERLYEMQGEIAQAERELVSLGLAPGSQQALTFF